MNDGGQNLVTGSGYSATCSCNRIFTHPAALKNHQNTCTINREQLSTALEGARKVLAERRLKRKERISSALNPHNHVGVNEDEPTHPVSPS